MFIPIAERWVIQARSRVPIKAVVRWALAMAPGALFIFWNIVSHLSASAAGPPQGTALIVPPGAAAQVRNNPDLVLAHVEGIVLDGTTNTPLEGVRVDRSMGGSSRVSTNPEGRFAFDTPVLTICGLDTVNCTPEPFRIFAFKAGYAHALPDGSRLPENYGILITERRVLDLVIRLFPGGMVTGRVFDQYGQPAQGIEVVPFRYVYNEAGTPYKFVHDLGRTRTNDRGEYRFGPSNALGPGDYFLAMETDRELQDDPLGTSVYYPGVTDAARALPVHVDSGAETHLKDVTLSAIRGGMLRLHVINEGGAAQRTRAELVVYRKGESRVFGLVRRGNLPQDMGDTVEVGHLPPGDYEVRMQFGVAPAVVVSGQASVTTGETDTLVDIVMRRFAGQSTAVSNRALTERLDNKAPSPVSGVRLAVLNINAFTGDVANRQRISEGSSPWVSRADGSWPMLELWPDAYRQSHDLRYLAILETPPGMAVISIRDDSGRDVLKNGLQVETETEINLSVVLTESAGTVEGTLSDAKGQRISGGIVALIPDDPNQSQFLIARTADMKGQFKLQAVPGAYHLYAWRELNGAAYRNADFMQTYRQNGVPVRVEEKSNITMGVKVLE